MQKHKVEIPELARGFPTLKTMADKRNFVERVLLKKKLEEEKKKKEESLIPYLPKECISLILVRLPLESLSRTRMVCKTWYRIISSGMFAQEYIERSESSLIFMVPVRPDGPLSFYAAKFQEKPSGFSVESQLFKLQGVPVLQQPLINPSSLYNLQFMEIRNGMVKIQDYAATCLGNIRACCGGLILLDNTMKRGGLIVLNPVTRELTALPVGTIFPPHLESYALVFCHSAKQYKVVHLFMDGLRHVGCEILNLGDKFWRMVDGPAFGVLKYFGYDPVFASGAVHWVPFSAHSEYILSITVDAEKFQQIALPKSFRALDRILEMCGKLGSVCHEESKQIDVWILKGLCGEGWSKQYTIQLGGICQALPLYFTRINGEMVFQEKNGQLYAYNCSLQHLRELEMPTGSFSRARCHYAHVNSLLSWKVKDQNVHDY